MNEKEFCADVRSRSEKLLTTCIEDFFRQRQFAVRNTFLVVDAEGGRYVASPEVTSFIIEYYTTVFQQMKVSGLQMLFTRGQVREFYEKLQPLLQSRLGICDHQQYVEFYTSLDNIERFISLQNICNKNITEELNVRFSETMKNYYKNIYKKCLNMSQTDINGMKTESYRSVNNDWLETRFQFIESYISRDKGVQS
jgi:hypothetical protein